MKTLAAAELASPGMIEPDHTRAQPTGKAAARAPASEQRHSVVEASLDLILIVDRKGNFLEVSPSAKAILDYAPEEMIGRSAVDFVYPDDLDRVRAEMRATRRGRELRNFETRYVHKSGRAVPLQWNGVWSEPESRYYFIGRNLEDLQFRDRLFRLAVESCPSGMLSVNAAGNILLVNGEIERQFGYRREELVGQTVDMLLPERLRATHLKQRLGYAVRPQPRPVGAGRELVGRRKDGSEFPVEIALNPIETREGTVVLAVVVDIGERKRAEAQLLQSMEELKRSNEELAQFANIASHDLQEPLRMVSMFAQLLAERYKGHLDGDADAFLGFLVEGAHRMRALIDGLLTFSRVQSAARELRPTDSEEILRRALADLTVTVDESKAEVTHEPLPTVMADGSQMEQLFQNIVGNAIKFAGDSPPRIHISADHIGAQWIFSVRDHGIGIDPRYHDRIFGIFQRLHARDAYPGTGIGLSICKRIVERHGGRIWVESAEGQGATFYFSVPAVPASLDPPRSVRRRSPKGEPAEAQLEFEG